MLGVVGLRVLQHTTRAACASLPTSIVPPLAVSVSATSAFHCCGPRLADDAPPSSSTTSFGAYAAVPGSALALHSSVGAIRATTLAPVTWFLLMLRLAKRACSSPGCG